MVAARLGGDTEDMKLAAKIALGVVIALLLVAGVLAVLLTRALQDFTF
jgi:hypothetical protein